MGSGYLLEGNGVGELLREGIGQGGSHKTLCAASNALIPSPSPRGRE
jgi:hypothetical protein